MSEETKQVWDNLFRKLNEKEKTFLAVVNNEKNKEIKKLYSIIKEAREYIENKQKLNGRFGTITLNEQSQKELLQILDKGE